MKLYLPFLVLAVASLAGDALCRAFARGGDPEKMLATASEKIARLPEKIGPWQAKNGEPLSADVVRMLECRAHASRIYVHQDTGDQIGFMLLAGSAGPLVSHTAEICYGSVAFDIIEPPRSEVIRGTGENADVFHQVLFQSKATVSNQKQRVYYSWHKFDGHWESPESPRLALGGQPMLYKLQLASSDSAPGPAGSASDADPIHSFLNDLLPVLDEILKSQ